MGKFYFLIFIFVLFIWLLQVLVAAHGIFSCSTWNLVSWPGIEPGPPALGAWSLNHWTTREAPWKSFNMYMLFSNSLSSRVFFIIFSSTFGCAGSSLQHMVFSSWGIQALEPAGSVIAALGLSWPTACEMLSSLTRNQTCVPWVGRQILNHWITREIQNSRI